LKIRIRIAIDVYAENSFAFRLFVIIRKKANQAAKTREMEPKSVVTLYGTSATL
jgi:hypothetical protein